MKQKFFEFLTNKILSNWKRVAFLLMLAALLFMAFSGYSIKFGNLECSKTPVKELGK